MTPDNRFIIRAVAGGRYPKLVRLSRPGVATFAFAAEDLDATQAEELVGEVVDPEQAERAKQWLEGVVQELLANPDPAEVEGLVRAIVQEIVSGAPKNAQTFTHEVAEVVLKLCESVGVHPDVFVEQFQRLQWEATP